ncbi:MAG: type II toxin-antitoxin system mRNA interferase toxin, RelE/StbE family [Bacteriovoracales bacterium]
MKLTNQVVFDKVKKELKKLPDHILRKLQKWAEQVEMLGLWEIKKIPGYHDEPLAGDRKGQRSIRLSKSYRAIYMEERDGSIELILIIEVNKHKY